MERRRRRPPSSPRATARWRRDRQYVLILELAPPQPAQRLRENVETTDQHGQNAAVLTSVDLRAIREQARHRCITRQQSQQPGPRDLPEPVGCRSSPGATRLPAQQASPRSTLRSAGHRPIVQQLI